MHELFTTIGLSLLTLLAVGLSVVAVLRLRSSGDRATAWSAMLMRGYGVLTVGCVVLFVHRWWFVSGRWLPLEAHVDGLLLIGVLLAAGLWFLQQRWKVPGVGLFALPMLVVLLAWAVCASRWTFHPFAIDSVWMVIHLAGVYAGTLGFVTAAGAGAVFLMIDALLRKKQNPQLITRLGSLEATEKLMIRAAALGFALLTIGLVSGLVIVTSGPTAMGPGWWHDSKVVLGTLAWVSYGLVMNVRHTTQFRGKRAAVLSIAGLVLLLSTFAVAVRLPAHDRDSTRQRDIEHQAQQQEVQ